MTRVALVDDHELLRSGLAAIINSFDGYNVIMQAGNGREFIDQLGQDSPPDIVLLDITMPVMDGFETAEWIKKNLLTTRVLVLSMLENDIAIIRMMKNGARGYLLKDSKPKIFKQALDNIRDTGYFINELISDKLMNYISNGNTFAVNAPFGSLSDNEVHFLRLICSDKTYKEIAEEMCVSPRTVDSYRDNLFKKLDIKTRVGLAIFAMKHNLVEM
jgi:DNA-binding NarL/FixJ family response regulator